jgi:hypothetical protein
MKFFVRAVVSGFGFSLGAAIYKKVSTRLGLEDQPANQKQGNEPEREVREAPDSDADDRLH